MEARYIGDPNNGGDGPRGITLFDTAFRKGQWTDVSGLSEGHREKLAGNGHFQTREAGSKDEPVMPAEAVEEAEDAASEADDPIPAVEAVDGDASGSMSRVGLIAELERLGASYDARWGVPKLTKALEEARFLAGED